MAANELKSLKQISFPDMDSDALPSTYVMKVTACIGKWQMKLYDLGGMMDSSNATMKPFPVFIQPYYIAKAHSSWGVEIRYIAVPVIHFLGERDQGWC